MNTLSTPAPLRKDGEVIGLIGLAHGTSHFFHLMFPPLFPWLMAEFSLNYTQAGLLMTVFFVVSGIGQALAGFVVDRLGARPVLYFGIGTLGVSALILGMANSYSQLIAAAVVAGLGNSIFHPADFTVLNRRVSVPRLGHAFSTHGLSGNLGWAFAPVFMAGIASLTHWRTAAFAAAAVGFLVLLALYVRRRTLAPVDGDDAHAAPTEQPTDAPPQHQLGFLRSGAVWACFLFFLLTTTAFGILQNYAPPILNHLYGLPLAAANTALTLYLLGSAAGMLLGGFLASRAARSERLIAIALSVAATMAVTLASGSTAAWTVVPLMLLMGMGVGIAGPSRDLLVRQAATARFGKAAYGRVYGFVYSGLDVGIAAAPVMFGPLLDRGEFGAAMFGVAVMQIAALSTAVGVGRRSRLGASAGAT